MFCKPTEYCAGPESLLLTLSFLHFPTFNCLFGSLPFAGLFSSLLFSTTSLAVIMSSAFSFTPFIFSFSATFFPYLFVSVFVCVGGIGSGSSPTSSQNEALPPSTDWPVSAYTSSFSLSSPETDDAGTWFIHNLPPPPSSSLPPSSPSPPPRCSG